MSHLIVHGGAPLRGRIVPSANKNAVLPILCATLLTHEPVRLRRVPDTTDVRKILDVFRRDGWKVLLAGVGTLAVLSLVSLTVYRDIFDLFVAAVRRPATPETVPLSEWDLPLIAHKLRHAIDPHRFWIQFVPLGVACGLMAAHKLWLGRRWCWREQLPWAVLVSCLYAPYGGWIFDLVVLLVPAVQVVARAKGWVLTAAVVLVNVVAIRPLNLEDFGWYAPAMGVVWAASCLRRERASGE